MFVVRKSSTLQSIDSKPEELALTLLYAYGGYGVVMQPYFSVSNLVLMNNMNGIYCMANIRGGGEYGEEWHQAA